MEEYLNTKEEKRNKYRNRRLKYSAETLEYGRSYKNSQKWYFQSVCCVNKLIFVDVQISFCSTHFLGQYLISELGIFLRKCDNCIVQAMI